MRPALSIVICTRNRAALLRDCLASLGRQSVPARDFEVIVVDNGSTDATPDRVREFESSLSIRRMDEPRLGLSYARNTGWRAAQADYVAFLDDDAEACDEWASAAIAAIKTLSPAPDAMAGSISLKWETPRPSWLSDALLGPLGHLWWGDQPLLMKPDQKMVGANCCFRRAVLQDLGGFSEDLGRKGSLLLSGEETELQDRLVSLEKRIWYCPGMAVRHFVPRARMAPAWFYKRYFWGGVSDCLMRRMISDKQSRAAKAEAPPAFVTLGEKLKRVFSYGWHALGLLSTQAETVYGRVYFSYAFGWLAARAGYRAPRG
jgi:GT2 family glycosyltransferase